MISFSHRGNFSKTMTYMGYVKKRINNHNLDKYGSEGVEALRNATPKDSGLTADSWSYKIIRERDSVRIVFNNSNVVNDWANIAILLQYGHATRNGGFVQGRDYINPAIQPIFDKIAENAWKEIRGG